MNICKRNYLLHSWQSGATEQRMLLFERCLYQHRRLQEPILCHQFEPKNDYFSRQKHVITMVFLCVLIAHCCSRKRIKASQFVALNFNESISLDLMNFNFSHYTINAWAVSPMQAIAYIWKSADCDSKQKRKIIKTRGNIMVLAV